MVKARQQLQTELEAYLITFWQNASNPAMINSPIEAVREAVAEIENVLYKQHEQLFLELHPERQPDKSDKYKVDFEPLVKAMIEEMQDGEQP